MRQPKPGERVPEYLTPEQLQMLLRCVDADCEMKKREGQVMSGEVLWLKDLILLAVGTGLRMGELVSLRWSAVDVQGGFLTVRNTEAFTTKSGDERRIPLAGDALSTIRRLHAARADDLDGYVLTGTGGGRLNPSMPANGSSTTYALHGCRNTSASILCATRARPGS